jgi:predicted NBD/HSP70 family sugar kinase
MNCRLLLLIILFCVPCLATSFITIDAGGTHTRIALWQDGKLSDITIFDTPHYQSTALKGATTKQCQELWLTALTEKIIDYRKRYPQAEGVTMGFPGPVTDEGTLVRSNNLWGPDVVASIPKSRLEERFGLPVTVASDITVALYAYINDPAYKQDQRIAVLTISTGLSIKLYDKVGKQVVKDAKGRGGSIGQLMVTGRCQGKLEQCSAGKAFARLALLMAATPTAKQLYANSPVKSILEQSHATYEEIDPATFNPLFMEGITKNDSFCKAVLKESITYLAPALEAYILATAPQRIILRGGVVDGLGETYRSLLLQALKGRGVFGYSEAELDDMIQLSALHGGVDGLMGAPIMVAHEKN